MIWVWIVIGLVGFIFIVLGIFATRNSGYWSSVENKQELEEKIEKIKKKEL